MPRVKRRETVRAVEMLPLGPKVEEVATTIEQCSGLPGAVRIAIYNRLSRSLRALVADICDDPVLAVQLVPTENVEANDYNPNHVASPEMDLLEQSIRCDGVTMPVVSCRDEVRGKWRVVDGFHRYVILKDRLKRCYVPCSEIDKGLDDRMAATIRHNRARGKHQVDLMAAIVRSLLQLGWNDTRIAEHIGMTPEELLRLKQLTGVAALLAGSEYSQSWGQIDDGEDPAL
jgi:ParB-like chromosome segregation protein Spo0J